MDAKDQEYAEYEFKEAKSAKVYELKRGYENDQAYNTLHILSILRVLFVRYGEGIPLQACLIELLKVWYDLGFTDPYPVSFSEDELQRH